MNLTFIFLKSTPSNLLFLCMTIEEEESSKFLFFSHENLIYLFLMLQTKSVNLNSRKIQLEKMREGKN